jgi:uncharacterized protein
MKLLDSHLHLTDITWNDLEAMSLAGIEEIVSPVQLSASKAVSSETIREMWDFQLEIQLQRSEEHLIKAHSMLGISMVSTPKDGMPELLKLLNEYLKRPKVVAIGEIGFEPNSRTCKDLKVQETIFTEQLKIAKMVDIPVVIHVPHPADKKKEFTEKSLALCNEYGLSMSKVIIDHSSEANIKIVLDAGAYAAITVQPWRNLTPNQAADLVKEYGSERLMINSDSSGRISDPLAVPKTRIALRRKGVADDVITKVCWSNGKQVYGI